jgi:hypothetical protein
MVKARKERLANEKATALSENMTQHCAALAKKVDILPASLGRSAGQAWPISTEMIAMPRSTSRVAGLLSRDVGFDIRAAPLPHFFIGVRALPFDGGNVRPHDPTRVETTRSSRTSVASQDERLGSAWRSQRS